MSMQAKFSMLVLMSLWAISSIAQSTTDDVVVFSKDLGQAGVLQVIRSPLVPTTTQPVITREPTTQPENNAVKLPARYRFMFSSKSAAQERQIFLTATYSLGDPFHAYAAEVVDGSFLVVVYEREGLTYFHVIQLDPDKPDKGLPKIPPPVLHKSAAFGTPNILTAEIQGSLEQGTLVVVATAEVSSADYRSREREVLRFNLQKRNNKQWEWIAVP